MRVQVNGLHVHFLASAGCLFFPDYSRDGFIRRICRNRTDANCPVTSLCPFFVKWRQAGPCEGIDFVQCGDIPQVERGLFETLAKLSMGNSIRVCIESSTTPACSLLSAAERWLRSRGAT